MSNSKWSLDSTHRTHTELGLSVSFSPFCRVDSKLTHIVVMGHDCNSKQIWNSNAKAKIPYVI